MDGEKQDKFLKKFSALKPANPPLDWYQGMEGLVFDHGKGRGGKSLLFLFGPWLATAAALLLIATFFFSQKDLEAGKGSKALQSQMSLSHFRYDGLSDAQGLVWNTKAKSPVRISEGQDFEGYKVITMNQRYAVFEKPGSSSRVILRNDGDISR